MIIADTCGSLTITTTFIETPRPGIVADGSDARFRCHHRRTNRITFLVDGLSLNDSLVENASIVALPDRNGRSLFILMFEATQVLDGSTIVCIAVFRNGCPNQETLPALLLIQGIAYVYVMFGYNYRLSFQPRQSTSETNVRDTKVLTVLCLQSWGGGELA